MTKLFTAKLLLAAWMLGITVASRGKDRHWVGTWTSMPQEVEIGNLAPPPFVSIRLCAFHMKRLDSSIK